KAPADDATTSANAAQVGPTAGTGAAPASLANDASVADSAAVADKPQATTATKAATAQPVSTQPKKPATDTSNTNLVAVAGALANTGMPISQPVTADNA